MFAAATMALIACLSGVVFCGGADFAANACFSIMSFDLLTLIPGMLHVVCTESDLFGFG